MARIIGLLTCFILSCVCSAQEQETRLVGVGVNLVYKIVDDEAVTIKQLNRPQWPQDIELLINGGKFWGTTSNGGSTGNGIIFSINMDGTGYSIVHSFSKNDGSFPLGGLTEYNGKLWGVTSTGGNNDLGVLYRINTDGSGYEVVYHLTPNEGAAIGRLTVSNGKLWGTGQNGGSTNNGTIFSYSAAEGMIVRHSFSYTDGSWPFGTLEEFNSRLWGVTIFGGQFYGVIFSISIDGNDFRVDQEFDGFNGGIPIGGMIAAEGRLWGTTTGGGEDGRGALFSINGGGDEYTLVHSFSFDGDDNGSPRGRLAYKDGYLWGAAMEGGSSGGGFLYKVKADGSEFVKYHEFTPTGVDGFGPWCTLVESNGRFWGGTAYGGTTGNGILFSIAVDGTDYTIEHQFNDSPVTGSVINGTLIESDNRIIGTTQQGGIYNDGVVFSMNKDGSNYTVTHHFNNVNGSRPLGLVKFDNRLWGVTSSGGGQFRGTIFSLDMSGNDFQLEYDFDESVGTRPSARLVPSGGKLWGVTYQGVDGAGNIFSFDPSTTFTEPEHNFTSYTTGSSPNSEIIVANNKFWSVTNGGSLGNGVIYRFDLDGSNYEVVHEFESGGSSWYGHLTHANNKVWGVAEEGQFLFSINETGENFTLHRNFIDEKPVGSLTLFNERIYGLLDGIANDQVFSVNTEGSDFRIEATLDNRSVLNYSDSQLTPMSFVEQDPVTGIEKEINNDVKIYPNPATSVINVRFSKAIPNFVNMELIDITGRSVSHHKLQGVAKDQIESYDVTGMTRGIFILKISTPKGAVNARVAIR